jgi:hypothetical protein
VLDGDGLHLVGLLVPAAGTGLDVGEEERHHGGWRHRFCEEALAEDAAGLLRLAVEQFSLSARAYHRVLKLARTIADLAGQQTIASYVAEALQYGRRQV